MSETTVDPTKGSAQAAAQSAQTSAAKRFEELADDAKEVAGKFFGRVKDFGENVAGSTREMMSGARLNSEKSQKQHELNEAFQKLGEMAYRQGGLTGEMAKISDQIHELYEQLQNIEIRRNAQGVK